MRAFQGIDVIHQCTRCFSLRAIEAPECLTCRDILNVHSTETRPLVLMAVVTDSSPTVPSYGTYSNSQKGGFRA
jgi:hypothetical protein